MADRQAPAERSPRASPRPALPRGTSEAEVGGGEGGVALDADLEVGASDAVEVDNDDVLGEAHLAIGAAEAVAAAIWL